MGTTPTLSQNPGEAWLYSPQDLSPPTCRNISAGLSMVTRLERFKACLLRLLKQEGAATRNPNPGKAHNWRAAPAHSHLSYIDAKPFPVEAPAQSTLGISTCVSSVIHLWVNMEPTTCLNSKVKQSGCRTIKPNSCLNRPRPRASLITLTLVYLGDDPYQICYFALTVYPNH